MRRRARSDEPDKVDFNDTANRGAKQIGDNFDVSSLPNTIATSKNISLPFSTCLLYLSHLVFNNDKSRISICTAHGQEPFDDREMSARSTLIAVATRFIKASQQNINVNFRSSIIAIGNIAVVITRLYRIKDAERCALYIYN